MDRYYYIEDADQRDCDFDQISASELGCRRLNDAKRLKVSGVWVVLSKLVYYGKVESKYIGARVGEVWVCPDTDRLYFTWHYNNLQTPSGNTCTNDFITHVNGYTSQSDCGEPRISVSFPTSQRFTGIDKAVEEYNNSGQTIPAIYLNVATGKVWVRHFVCENSTFFYHDPNIVGVCVHVAQYRAGRWKLIDKDILIESCEGAAEQWELDVEKGRH